MFWTRLASGIVLVIIALMTMGFGGPLLAFTLLAISMIAYKELTKALKCNEGNQQWNALEVIGLVGIACYYAAVYFAEETDFWLMTMVGILLAEMFAYVLTFPKFHANQVVASVFAFFYAPVMLSFVYLTRMSTYGNYMIWLILISAWGCDTCAYVVGKLIGKKKIFPVLSPHKSLEGCIGGVAGAALLGFLYGHFYVQIPNQPTGAVMAVICAVGAVMSMVGDLTASAIKRNNDIKDYGKLIPGHGGIMDRFDSMIVTAPMTYFLTMLLLHL